MHKQSAWSIFRASPRISHVGYGRRAIHLASQVPKVVPTQPIDAPVRVRLREYQEECIQAVLSHLLKGQKRLGISLATGSGKTVIFTQLIDRVPVLSNGASQTLILAHRRELVEQAARHCQNAYPSKRIEVELGSLHASGTADITVASIQSICSGDRIAKFDPKKFKLVLVDEAHHIVAPGYLDTLQHFGLLDPTASSPALVGVSATLSRFDGIRLGAALDQIVYHKDYVDMIGEKWLSDVIFTTVQSRADVSKVKKGAHGDFQPGDLSRAVNTSLTNDLTVRAWLARAKERKSTIVFCVDIAHVVALTNTFRRHGIDAMYVTGNTSKKDRTERLDRFKNSEFPVLVNCGVFTEGTDIPNIDCVVLARPTKSRNLLVQMIGRGMRLYPGKKDCHILDMVASLETGIVTTPTLFGLDPSEIVEGKQVHELKQIKEARDANEHQEVGSIDSSQRFTEQQDSPSLSRTITFTDYTSVFDLIADTSADRHIRALSPHAWVEVGPEKYVLSSGPAGRILTLERLTNPSSLELSFEVRLTEPVPQHEHLRGKKGTALLKRPRVLAQAGTLLDALHAADTYATTGFPFHAISTNQAWRQQPASNAQLEFLNRFRRQDEQLTAGKLLKGKAADMITKIKHGARGRWKKSEGARKKEEREEMRRGAEAVRRRREKVEVGPTG